MKRILILLAAAIMSLGSCGVSLDVSEDEPTSTVELTETAIYEDYTLVLGDAEVIYSDTEESDILVIHATYTNAGEPMYARASFAVRAFQNDIATTEYFGSYFDIEDNMTTEIKNGASINVVYCFSLQDNSDVEIVVGTPTASRDTIGRKVYKISEMIE